MLLRSLLTRPLRQSRTLRLGTFRSFATPSPTPPPLKSNKDASPPPTKSNKDATPQQKPVNAHTTTSAAPTSQNLKTDAKSSQQEKPKPTEPKAADPSVTDSAKGLSGYFRQYSPGNEPPRQPPNDPKPDAKPGGNKNTPPPPPSGGGSGAGGGGGFNFNFSINGQLAIMITSAILYSAWQATGANAKEITWQEFRTSFLDKGLVEKVTVVNGHSVRVHLNPTAANAVPPGDYYFSIGGADAFERRLDEAQRELGIPVGERIPVVFTDELSTFSTLLTFAPTILIIGFFYWMSRRGPSGSGGIMNVVKGKAKAFDAANAKVKFADVAGMDDAKQEIMEFVSFLKDPDRYTKLGAKIPRGAILSGPPGTGKTLIAKATAGEAGVPFFSVSGSEFVEMFVGVGASRVRELFENARKKAPSIVFIDEIDAIGRARSSRGHQTNDERESTLNQLLVEMDGFSTKEQVIVLAGTNRPEVLDSALMRPGRFDRHIRIESPTVADRTHIYGVHLRPLTLHQALLADIKALAHKLAVLTPGMSGADIANVCNEAALHAARRAADTVNSQDFDTAIERVIVGLKSSSKVLSPEDKKTVAYHEAGHAICGWFLEHAHPLLKVSIIPHGNALGYAQYLPEEHRLKSIPQMQDEMCMTLGGRVSEEIFFGAENITSGAQDDLRRVQRVSFEAITNYGMDASIGPISYGGASTIHEQMTKPFSEKTSEAIDAAVRNMVVTAYDRCRALLTEHREDVEKVASLLLTHEVITREDMRTALGRRPLGKEDEMDKWLDINAAQGGLGDAPPNPLPDGPAPEPAPAPVA